MPASHTLSCHCGAVQIEVTADLNDLTECNCSTCARTGFLHWYIPKKAMRLLKPKVSLSTYVWQDADGGHHFCPTCGTGVLRTGYDGDRVSVNARCINGIDVFALSPKRFDGRTIIPPGPDAHIATNE